MKYILLGVFASVFSYFSFLNKNQEEKVAFAPPPAACETLTGVEKIVCLADAFKATLSSAQQSSVQLDFTTANAIKWSNLPGGVSIRNGLEYSALSATQLAAALAVVEAASGTTANEGYAEYQQIRAADTYLGAKAGSGYSEGKYIIAFLGTPSTTGKWMLQFGGHHYAQNITFNAGKVISVTPSHQGVEPLSFTTTGGATYAPMQTDHAGMLAMLSSLTSTQLSAAKLSGTFSDVVLGPKKDGQFPATKLGIPCSSLTAPQKALVLAAMKSWTNDCDDATAASSLALYEKELDATYIAYSGNATLSNNADYVRIDGPSVWIELVCQSGVVYSGVHYHAVYRDHTRDYGAGTSITASKEVYGSVASNQFSIGTNYPNPFSEFTTIPFTLANPSHVTVTVYDLSGRVIAVLADEDMDAGKQSVIFNQKKELKGTYIYKIKVKNNNGEFSQSKFMLAL